MVLLFVWGTGICLLFGRLGFMPLDQSIVFDGGWRVLHGQVPLRDFHTPNGITPILLQAVLFKLVGVSWFTYCLHAALCNGLFGVIAYQLLKSSGGSPRLSFVYACLSAAIFYPPVGTPYMEQHAFLLLLAAIVVALSGQPRSWVVVPSLWVGAFLAKQIPTVLSVPLLFWLLYSTPIQNRRRAWGWLLTGSLIAGTVVLVTALQLGIDGAWTDLWQRPSELGQHRWSRLLQPTLLGTHLTVLRGIVDDRDRVFVWSFPTVIVAMACFFHRATATGRRLFLLAAALLLMCWLFVLLTENHAANGIPYILLSAGCVHLGLRHTTFPHKLSRIAQGMVLFVAMVDAAAFQHTVNARRVVHDFVFDRRVAEQNAADLPGQIRFMRLDMPAFYNFSARDLNALVHFFRNREGNLFVLGDTSILYALTDRPSVNPALWFHPGLTVPYADDSWLSEYEAQLLENLDRFDVRFIVEEQDGTWMRTRLSDFPRLTTLIENTLLNRHTVGSFAVAELWR